MSALIPIARATALVNEAASASRPEPEAVPVEDALGRILARDLTAAGDVPPFANSAMDGYAVSPGPAGRRLPVVGESRAGHPATRALGDADAIRISTGAALPPGAAAVIRQEDAEEHGGEITLAAAVATGQNVREAGDDVRAGQLVLPAGTTLGPSELAAAVAAGSRELACSRRPRVAVLSTGDELQAPGARLGPGEIHDTASVGLAAAAREAGAAVVLAQRIADSRGATEDALDDALERAAVIVISGGVSVGPHDHVKPALAALGVEERFWGVALKPGKPTWFGCRGDRLVFGLPGNPVSAMVTFRLFVRPALRALLGTLPEPPPASARLSEPVRRERREQAVRVKLRAEEGVMLASVTGDQGSHRLSSLAGADGLALIPAGEGELAAGETVAVLLL
jgi:molybdopterin molybdotransferase